MRMSYVLCFLLAGFSTHAAVFATELPKEGSYDFTSCWSGVSNTIAFSKAHTASSYEMTGSVLSNPPGGMFDKNSFRCVGMNASLDGKYTGSAVCEAVDVDGDKRLSKFSLASDGSLTRETVAGTGAGCRHAEPVVRPSCAASRKAVRASSCGSAERFPRCQRTAQTVAKKP